MSEFDRARQLDAEMRLASGSMNDDRKIVGFLYLLARDEVCAAKVTQLVDQVAAHRGEFEFTNGWIAEWAAWEADRLVGVPTSAQDTMVEVDRPTMGAERADVERVFIALVDAWQRAVKVEVDRDAVWEMAVYLVQGGVKQT